MPLKKEFSRDLINVNILRKDYETIKILKRYHEPFYSLLNRYVIERQDKVETDWLIEELRDTNQKWMKRALEAEKKLESINGMLSLDLRK